MSMKQILVMMAVVVFGGGANDTPENSQTDQAEAQVASKPTPDPDPVSPADDKLIAEPIVERVVREKLEKPEDILNEADLEKVAKLFLNGTQMTDAGLKEVAKMQKLERLYVADTQITYAGLKEVAKLQRLKSLSLAFTQITDAGLKKLAKLKKSKFLSLFRTKVTDEDVAKLKKALPTCKIIGP